MTKYVSIRTPFVELFCNHRKNKLNCLRKKDGYDKRLPQSLTLLLSRNTKGDLKLTNVRKYHNVYNLIFCSQQPIVGILYHACFKQAELRDTKPYKSEAVNDRKSPYIVIQSPHSAKSEIV